MPFWTFLSEGVEFAEAILKARVTEQAAEEKILEHQRTWTRPTGQVSP